MQARYGVAVLHTASCHFWQVLSEGSDKFGSTHVHDTGRRKAGGQTDRTFSAFSPDNVDPLDVSFVRQDLRDQMLFAVFGVKQGLW